MPQKQHQKHNTPTPPRESNTKPTIPIYPSIRSRYAPEFRFELRCFQIRHRPSSASGRPPPLTVRCGPNAPRAAPALRAHHPPRHDQRFHAHAGAPSIVRSQLAHAGGTRRVRSRRRRRPHGGRASSVVSAAGLCASPGGARLPRAAKRPPRNARRGLFQRVAHARRPHPWNARAIR